jgi:hypothetical protein
MSHSNGLLCNVELVSSWALYNNLPVAFLSVNSEFGYSIFLYWSQRDSLFL